VPWLILIGRSIICKIISLFYGRNIKIPSVKIIKLIFFRVKKLDIRVQILLDINKNTIKYLFVSFTHAIVLSFL